METGGWGSPPPGGQQGGGQSTPHADAVAYGRCRKRTKAGVYTADITYDDLKARFNMPSQKAADSLGVGLTIFKRLCRRFGLQKWPYRQLLKQRREERRKSGGGGRREYSSASDSETEEEDAGGTPSEVDHADAAAAARHGERRRAEAAPASRTKRQRTEQQSPYGGAAAAAAAAAAGGMPCDFPPLGPPPQQAQQAQQEVPGGWPMQQAQQAQHQPQLMSPSGSGGGAVTTGWQAGITQFQRRPGMALDPQRTPWELPAVAGGTGGGRAAMPMGSPSVKVELISPRDVGGSPASFSSLLEALQRQSVAGGLPVDEQALLELKREQLLQQYSGMGPVPGTAGPGGTGDRNQWYSMNLAGGSTFGAAAQLE